MYLSRLILNPLNRYARRDLADCQELHRTVMRAFPNPPNGDSPRGHYGVLHRLDIQPQSGIPTLLVLSREKPDWSSLEQWPDYLSRNPDWIDPAYDAIQDNQTFTFRLRANPTRKVDTKTGPDGCRRHGRREPLRSPEEQIEWLRRKGQSGGFRLLSVRLSDEVSDVRLIPEPVVVHGKKKSHTMTFSSIVFEGRLSVTNASRFQETLSNGIGSAKAYGFGLLSIRPS